MSGAIEVEPIENSETEPEDLVDNPKGLNVLELNHDDDGNIIGKLLEIPSGGALWAGKSPNHRPGPGRPSNEIRAEMRGVIDDVLPRLRRILADRGDELDHKDLLRILDKLGKYSIGTKTETDNVHRAGNPVVMLPSQDVEE